MKFIDHCPFDKYMANKLVKMAGFYSRSQGELHTLLRDGFGENKHWISSDSKLLERRRSNMIEMPVRSANLILYKKVLRYEARIL